MAINKTAKLTLEVGERDHSLGLQDAQVTLVEYGDLQCVHCRNVKPVIRELQSRMGSRLRYVFRHFPIQSAHPDAQLAAEAAEAAAAQGKFWEMYDLLFEHQDQLDENHLIEYARTLDLDVEKFSRELGDHVYAERVKEDFVSGVRSGVNGTPSFYINGSRYDGLWDLDSLAEAIQKPLGMQVRSVFQEFDRLEASGGIVLLVCALIALVWANSAWAETYYHLWEIDIGFSVGSFSFHHHLLEWINDGLMAIFFLVVGLEIKREVTTGELAEKKRAMLPMMAAVGGMLVPAGIYLILNIGGAGEPGWGIPMATDIAFMLGILALLGSRVPIALKVFFTALAIVDDLLAVLVIALFYTAGIQWIYLLFGLIILLILFGLNRARVYSPLPYALFGIVLWMLFLASGVHATIAGVLLAMTIPTRNPPNPQALLAQCVSMLNEFESPIQRITSKTDRFQAAAQTLEMVTERMQSPAQKLEHDLLPLTTYFILPVFALANAGVSLSFDRSLLSPISAGVVLGLVLGKPVGILLLTWITVKARIAELPANVSWRMLFSTSWLAGIGFTMALFIADSAFGDFNLISQAKIGILTASLLAGMMGYAALTLFNPTYSETTHMESIPTSD